MKRSKISLVATLGRKAQTRFLPLCSTIGNSNGLTENTKGGFLFVQIVSDRITDHERNKVMTKQPANKNVHPSKLIAMLAILLLCFTHLQVQAQCGFNSRRHRLGDAAKSGSWTNSDGTWGYCQTSSSELRITWYYGNAKSVTTPEKINGMPVRSIGRRAFAGTKMEELCIAEGVWTIETDAFHGCQSLRRVTLPKSLMRSCVESSPFQYCRNLESLIIPLSLKDSFNIPRQAKVFYYENEPAEVSVLSDTDDTVETEAVFNTNPEKAEEARPYQVKFDPNRDSVARRYGSEGVGFMSLISFKTGDVVKLPANKFTCSVREMRAGDFYTETYSFGGWATNKTGDVVFADEAEVQLDGDTTLYAKWILDHYLRFDANGGTGNMHAIRLKKGASVKLPKNGFECSVRPGHRYRKRDEEVCIMFSGWAADKGGKTVYAEGSEVSFDADKDVTLYAKWIDACEVHFMPNTSGIDEQMPNMKMPANVSFDLHTNSYMREGYEFQGWALEPEGEVKFEDGENVSFGHGIVKLYAKWSDVHNFHIVLHANNYSETYYEESGAGTPFSYQGRRRHRLIDRGDFNGGKVELLVPKGSAKTLPQNSFSCQSDDLSFCDSDAIVTRIGRYNGILDFAGWATNREGDVCYANGAAVKPDGDIDLYAVWHPRTKIYSDHGWLREVILYGNTSFELPAGVTNTLENCRWWRTQNLKEFHVHPDNPVYSAKDGILLDKSGEKALGLMIVRPNVAFPQSVKGIGDGFSRITIDEYAAADKLPGELVETVSLPDGILSIGDYAFSGYSRLQEINLPESLARIGRGAFNDCRNLKRVVIPNGVVGLGDHAFSGCTNLASVGLPQNLKSVREYSFNGCVQLREAAIPAGVTNIAAYAFRGCETLAGIAIPQSVVSIGESAFEECTALENISFGNESVRIHRCAFARCGNLENVEIPFAAFTNCASSAFHMCTNVNIHVVMPDGCRIDVDYKRIAKFYNNYSDWEKLADYVMFQARRNDICYKFPAHGICASHPALYKDFCAGASKVWCEQREAEIRENGERCDARFEYDDKLKILASVTIAFESPGVSVEALEAKYRKSAKGKFWKKQTTKGTVGDGKIAYEAKKARRLIGGNTSLEDSTGGAKVDLVSMGDDEIEVLGEIYESWGLMSLATSQDVLTGKAASPGKLGSITIRSRKLDAALAERDRKENEAKAKADAAAAAKKEAEALNF